MLAKRKTLVVLIAVLALSSVGGGASAQTISAIKTGEFDATAGNYIWQYKVENDRTLINADLFHFTLEMSSSALSSLITADTNLDYAPVYREVQFTGGPLLTDQLAIINFPTTEGGITGLKFDDGYLDNGDVISYRLLEFRLNQNFLAGPKTVAFAAGGTVNSSTSVSAPSALVRIPEPGALALCGIVLPLAAVARQRRS